MGILVIGQSGLRPGRVATERSQAGFWRRVWTSLVEARRRAANREIERFLGRHPELAGRVEPTANQDWKAAADALPF